MKMYTLEGMEVEVVKKIEEGYLAKMIYSRYWEEDEEVEEICNQVTFYEILYETAPTEKYADEVKRLIDTKNNLEKQVTELINKKRNEEALLNKVNKFPIIKALAAYLTGDFKFHLRFSNYEISAKENVYLSPIIKVINYKDSGWNIFTLRHENSESYDDTPFMIFSTKEEAVDYSRGMLISRMAQYKKNEYWSASGLKEEHNKISYTNPVKEDAEYLKVYNETFAFLVDKEKKKQAEKLKKEVEEFEAKKKKLSELEG
jgi:hypothetical protein